MKASKYCVLLLSLALVSIETLPVASATPLEIDEQVTFYIACGKNPSTVFRRATEESATPPGYFWLVHASAALGATVSGFSAEAWLRFPSILALLGSVVFIFVIGERWIGPGAGAVAGILLACHPLAITKMGHLSRPYSLGLFGSLLAIGSLLQLRAGSPSWRHVIGFVIGNMLLPWTHYLFLSIWPAEILLLGLIRGKPSTAARGKLHWSRAACLFLLAISAFSMAPLIPALYRLESIGPNLAWISQPPDWMLPIAFLGGWSLALAMALAFAGRLILIARARMGRNAKSASAGDQVAQTLPDPRTDGRIGLVLAVWFLAPIGLLWAAATVLRQPSLTQARYVLPQIGPAMLLVAWMIQKVSPTFWRAAPTVAFVCAIAAPQQIVDWLIHPVRHDRHWLEVAQLFNEKAGVDDVAFVQTGLVESRLTPALYADPGFQEYTTSRLSDFYLRKSLRRHSLPLVWPPGGEQAWLKAYTSTVEGTLAAGGQVWFVFSADTDVGQAVQEAARRWLEALGFSWREIRSDPVARVFVVTPKGV